MSRMQHLLHPQSFLSSLNSSSPHGLDQGIPHVQERPLTSEKTIYAYTTQRNHWNLVASIGLSVFVFLLSYVALRHLVTCATRREITAYRPFVGLYEDEDGEAYAESIQKASKSTPRLLILLCAVTGAAIDIVRATLDTVYSISPADHTKWVETGIWVLLLLQCVALCVSSSPSTTFSIGWRAGISSLVALLALAIQSTAEISWNDSQAATLILVGVQLLCGILISVLCFLIPQRPDVYYKGVSIDRQFTTSLLGWISFSWVDPILRRCERGSRLTVDDLPELDHKTRPETLYKSFRSRLQRYQKTGKNKLWSSIFHSQKNALIAQIIITVLLSFLSFVPQLALLRILTFLEARQNSHIYGALWVPIVGLGLSELGTATLETLKYWISYNKLYVRIQQQVSLAIFDKALRLNRASGGSGADVEEAHSPINMVAVDVKNIGDFFCFFFLSYESPLKLVIASVFLVRLLGWQSLLTGYSILAVLMIFNYFAVQQYSHKQGSLMKRRDRRLRMLTEVLQGIRQIKFSALEAQWEKRVNELRDTEMRAQWAVCFWQIGFVSMYFVSPILLSAACLSVYVLLNGHLSASTAFTSISVLNAIEVSMTILPDVISFLLNARVSVARIQDYLGQPERVQQVVPSDTIEFKDANIAWPGSYYSSGGLTSLNLQFPKNTLSVISGSTGSGKSLVLASILGDADIRKGTVCAPVSAPFEDIVSYPVFDSWVTNSALAFVSQSPWLQKGTVQENILLGLPLNEERYAEVIFACALEEDLVQLPQGDQTELSANGGNLSGGQRWRISLARAVYSRAQTLLMDDIFSAVDVHTREHIAHHVLRGELLHGRTCILATHHLDLCLPAAQYWVRLEGGTALTMPIGEHQMFPSGGKKSPAPSIELYPPSLVSLYRQPPSIVTDSSTSSKDCYRHTSGKSKSSRVSRVFMKEGGNLLQWMILGVAFFGFGVFMLGRSWWINIWTRHYQDAAQSTDPTERPIPNDLLYYLGMYLGLSLMACIFGVCRTYFSLSTALRASQRLFRQLLSAVLRAPIQWHDATPFGNILSRFSADFNILDSRQGDDLRATLEYGMDVAMAMVAGAIVNPMLIIVSAILLTIYILCARRFISASRQLKRLENTAKGPILEHLDACLSGLSTVRAFGQVNQAMEEFQNKVSRHGRAFWNLWLLNRWLGFRVNILGAALSAFSAALVAYLPNVDASTAGFAISFTVDISIVMALSIRRYVNFEQGMNSVARIHSYCTIDTEIYEGLSLPDSWPQEGRLEVSDLSVKHAPHLPPVLHNISFVAEPHQRVGVVGRTGAGKSSLVLALFRFLEASQGKILVDGIDIARIKLDQLRNRLAIIPQHPVLFRGTVHSNLDPFNEHTESSLLEALQAVGWTHDSISVQSSSSTSIEYSTDSIIDETVRSNTSITHSPLEARIQEHGENLSHGQQQLLCLARALIRRPKILILDEATSAVDQETDDLIQHQLRSAVGQFAPTLLVIAHRLRTVADFDRILVMDAGRVVEAGSPRDLLQMEGGVFRGMVEQDAEREELKGLIFGAFV